MTNEHLSYTACYLQFRLELFAYILVTCCWQVAKGIYIAMQKQPLGEPLCLAGNDCLMREWNLEANVNCRCQSHAADRSMRIAAPLLANMPASGWAACLPHHERLAQPHFTPRTDNRLLVDPTLALCLRRSVSHRRFQAQGRDLRHRIGSSARRHSRG